MATEPFPTPEPGRSALAAWLIPLGVALVAGLVRFWGLDNNGTGNFYYAAAARSMSGDWGNFFFNSFDPAGFTTIDKPPVAQWIQAISVRLFGYHSWSLLGPQAFMGAISAALICHLVGRRFGSLAGVVAGLAYAVSPANVAVDRDNLPDAALVMSMLLSAWGLTLAVETGRLRPLLLMAALTGVGFNVKMLAAYIVLPTFYIVYFFAANISWGRRFADLSLATVLLFGVSASWMIVVDLTPPEKRPFVGGSRNNTVRDLVLGYNGLGRITGQENNRPGPPGGGEPGGGPGGPPRQTGGPLGMLGNLFGMGGNGPKNGPMPFGPPGAGGGPPGMGFGGQPGWNRLANKELAGQAMWLFPFALFGGLAVMMKWERLTAASTALWLGWFLTHAIVFSTSKGIMHPYYLSMLAPPLAALTGIGFSAGIERIRYRLGSTWLILIGVGLTAAWQAHLLTDHPAWEARLRWFAWGGVGVLAVGLSLAWRFASTPRGTGLAGGTALVLSLVSLHVCPTAWSATLVFGKPTSMLPAGDPALLTGDGSMGLPGMIGMMGDESSVNEKLIAFLRANRSGERYLVITPNSMSAGAMIIATGEPIVAAGGFIGSDPALSAERLESLVKNGEARFVLTTMMPGPMGGGGDWLAWVTKHGKRVDAKYWVPDDATAKPGLSLMTITAQLYDCRPEAGLVSPPAN